jgi:hypothetical protein
MPAIPPTPARAAARGRARAEGGTTTRRTSRSALLQSLAVARRGSLLLFAALVMALAVATVLQAVR